MPTAPTVRVQAPFPNTGIVFERHKKGSWFQATFKAVFFGLVPLFVVYFAAFIAYVSTTPIPAGTFFWVVFQPSLWMATKTVEVGSMHICEGCSVLPAHIRNLSHTRRRLDVRTHSLTHANTRTHTQVPANFTILPRPAHEKFLELPGGSKMPMSVRACGIVCAHLSESNWF